MTLKDTLELLKAILVSIENYETRERHENEGN